MKDKKLHDHIEGSGSLDKESLKKLLKEAPYSQALQRLSNEDSVDFALSRYDWSPSKEAESLSFDDIVTLSEVNFSDKKTNSKKGKTSKRKAHSKTNKSSSSIKEEPKKPQLTIVEALSSETEASKIEADESSTTSINITSSNAANINEDVALNTAVEPELDSFTLWLNSLEEPNTDNDDKIQVKAEKKKHSSGKKKKKKSKKKSKKVVDEIKEKIEESITDKDEIVSLSLAELYEKQSYYAKAIEMYEKLSLKYPQKSAFFAAEIQKLKDKI